MAEKANNITNGSIHKGILALALPSMTGFILQNVFNLVDMFFVGKLGSGPLAAVSLSGIFVHFLYTFALGISTGTVALVARFEGSGRIDKARKVGKQALYLGLLMYVFVAVMGNLALEAILEFLGAGPDIIGDAIIYTRIILTAGIIVFVPMAINAYLRGVGDTVTPMRALLIATAVNLILDPILIFGWFGLPALGVAGSALATILARGVGVVYLLLHITRFARKFYIPFLPVEVDLFTMGRILRIGIFGSLQSLMRNFANLALMKLVALFGTGVIAAYGIGIKLQMAITLPILGLGLASSVMVGQNLGAEQVKRAEKSAWTSVLYGEIFMIAAAGIFFLLSRQIVSLFNNDPTVIEDGALFFRYFSPTFIFINLSVVLGKSLNGAGDTISPMVITFLGMIATRIPLAWLLSIHFGVEGIWMGIAASSVIQGFIYVFWFNHGKWKKQEV